MLGSETSRAQTYPFDTVPSQERRRSISSASQEAGWAGIPLVVSLLPFVLFLFLHFLLSFLAFFSFFLFFFLFSLLLPSPFPWQRFWYLLAFTLFLFCLSLSHSEDCLLTRNRSRCILVRPPLALMQRLFALAFQFMMGSTRLMLALTKSLPRMARTWRTSSRKMSSRRLCCTLWNIMWNLWVLGLHLISRAFAREFAPAFGVS